VKESKSKLNKPQWTYSRIDVYQVGCLCSFVFCVKECSVTTEQEVFFRALKYSEHMDQNI